MKSIFDILHDSIGIKTPNSLDLDKLFPNEPICKDAFESIIEEVFQQAEYRLFYSSNRLAKWLTNNRAYYDVVKEKPSNELEDYIHYLINHG